MVNPDKFQAIIKSCDEKKKTNMSYKWNFDEHIGFATPHKIELKTFKKIFVILWLAPHTEKSKFILS